jgi:hypothetical protein
MTLYPSSVVLHHLELVGYLQLRMFTAPFEQEFSISTAPNAHF